MKRKVVIKVTCCCSKARIKALKVTASVVGVEEAAFKGEKIEVTGEVDAVKLTTLLRKKLGQADLISLVTAVGGEKKEKEEDKEKMPSQQHLLHGRNRWRRRSKRIKRGTPPSSRGKDFGEEGRWSCSFDACDDSLCCGLVFMFI